MFYTITQLIHFLNKQNKGEEMITSSARQNLILSLLDSGCSFWPFCKLFLFEDLREKEKSN